MGTKKKLVQTSEHQCPDNHRGILLNLGDHCPECGKHLVKGLPIEEVVCDRCEKPVNYSWIYCIWCSNPLKDSLTSD